MGRRNKTGKRWYITWWRAVGQFKDGERRMMEESFAAATYRTRERAMKAQCKVWRTVAKPFIERASRKPKSSPTTRERRKIVELQLFEDQE